MLHVADIRRQFQLEKEFNPKAEHLEIIGACFKCTSDRIFGEPNEEYIQAELEWYESCDNRISALFEIYGKEVEIWKHTADVDGLVNSNYGSRIYRYNGCSQTQYQFVLQELQRDPGSRRAVMIYTMPQIHDVYDTRGMSDFICTNAVHYQIREGKLSAVVQMRSNDAVFGYNNDYRWQKHVLEKLANELSVEPGDIVWQVANLHVYKRHLGLV